MAETTRDDKKITVEIDEEKGERAAELVEAPRFGIPEGLPRHLVSAIAVAFSVFQLYTAAFGNFEQFIQRSVHLAFAVALIALTYRLRLPWGGRKGRLSIADWAFFAAGTFSALWIVVDYDRLMSRIFDVDPLTLGDWTWGIVLVLTVLEISRRTVSPALSILMVMFVAYGAWGYLIPGRFQAPQTDFESLFETIYLSGDGILGIPLGVSANYLFLFILFGGFIRALGLMNFLGDASLAIAGATTGGPAKVAVLCSAFFGTLSGSGLANAITTGSFTIPLMKRVGYKPHFAAGVEATASMGGNLMPPVMGAAAFIMADFLRVPYIEVVIAATIPAILYFFGVGAMVHFEALRDNIEKLPKDQLPKLSETLRRGWYMLTPVVVLMYFLFSGWSVSFSGLLAIASTLPVSWLRRDTAIGPRRLLAILENGALTALPVVAAVAVVGIMIGVAAHTGFAVKLALLIVSLSEGSLFLTLLVAMVASLVLGLGLPTTPAYIIVASVTAPALVRFGLEPITAHLFVFYYGILAAVTPPMAIASYALSGIAGSDPQRTMLTGFTVALAGFIVPFVFAYEPAMLDPLMRKPETTVFAVVSATLSAALGIIVLAMAIIGYVRMRALWWERIPLAAAAMLLVVPGIYGDLIGLCILALILAEQTVRKRRAGRRLAAAQPPEAT